MIGIEGTRESSQCEKGCESGTHGTTALLVIAKKGLCKSHKSFHFNKGCSTKNNNEKGPALHVPLGRVFKLLTFCF